MLQRAKKNSRVRSNLCIWIILIHIIYLSYHCRQVILQIRTLAQHLLSNGPYFFMPLLKSVELMRFLIGHELKWVFDLNCFLRFYLAKHNGRQLTLQPQLGSADLNAVFYGSRREDEEGKDGASSSVSISSSPRKHIIQVSTYQMCVLMLFNKREKLSYEVRQSLLFIWWDEYVTLVFNTAKEVNEVERHNNKFSLHRGQYEHL